MGRIRNEHIRVDIVVSGQVWTEGQTVKTEMVQ